MSTTAHTISLDKPYEVRHWMRTLNCSEGDLYDAVGAVGLGLAALQKYRVAMRKSFYMGASVSSTMQ